MSRFSKGTVTIQLACGQIVKFDGYRWTVQGKGPDTRRLEEDLNRVMQFIPVVHYTAKERAERALQKMGLDDYEILQSIVFEGNDLPPRAID